MGDKVCTQSDLKLVDWNVTHATGWVLGVNRLEPPSPPRPPAIQCAHVELRTDSAKAWHKARGLKRTITRDDDMGCHGKQM